MKTGDDEVGCNILFLNGVLSFDMREFMYQTNPSPGNLPDSHKKTPLLAQLLYTSPP